MSEEAYIRKAEFEPNVCVYWLLSGGLTMALTGVVDAKAFREAVLNQRERVFGTSSGSSRSVDPRSASDSAPLLSEIRDSLLRIELAIEKLKKRDS